MERSAYILFGLLVLTSSLALHMHQRRDTEDDGTAIVIWDVPSDKVTSFSFSSSAFQIDIEPKSDSLSRFWTAKSHRQIPQETLKKPNHKFGQIDRDTTIVKEDNTTQIRIKNFVLGFTGRSFLENMFPLRVKTILANSKGREAEFGFGKNAGKFTIETKAEKRSFDVGGTGYGKRVRYIKDQAGNIYALEDRLISILLKADTEFEGNIVFARESDDLISFEVKGQSPQAMKQVWRGEKSHWTVNGDESTKIKSWIESKLLTMTGAGFVPEELAPKDLETLMEFQMTLRGVDKKITGKLFRKNSTIRPVYYLQTDLTRQLVKMKSAQVVDLIASLQTL